MLDFTSALYLGLRHPSDSLGHWEALTLGRPAALREPPDADAVAADLARAAGVRGGRRCCPRRCISSGICSRCSGTGNVVILRDAGAYPIARWGTERAQGDGRARSGRFRITTRPRSSG